MCIIIINIKSFLRIVQMQACIHYMTSIHEQHYRLLKAYKWLIPCEKPTAVIDHARLSEHFELNTWMSVPVLRVAEVQRRVSCCNMNALRSHSTRRDLTAGSSGWPSLSARLTSRPLCRSAPIRWKRSQNQVIEAGLCLSDSVFPEFDLIAGIIWYILRAQDVLMWTFA